MPNLTTNYKLKKPIADTEAADIDVINENMDTIDAKLKEVDNKASNIIVPVTSVNNKTGAVTITANDVGAATPSQIPTKLSQLTNDPGYITAAPVASVNGKIGIIVLNAADVGAETPTGAEAKITTHKEETDPHPQYALDSDLTSLGQSVTSSLGEMQTYSTYKLNVDGNGIFTEIQYKRQNGTLIMKSVLSGGTSPKYTTRTETYYKIDGITVDKTLTYAITYTGDKVTSEVLQ